MTITFYCKNCKANKKGLAHIQLCINADQRIFITLPRQEKPEDFKKAMGMKKSSPIKEYCESVKRKIDDIVKEMTDEDLPITAMEIKNRWEGKGKNIFTLGDMWNMLLSVKTKELGVSIHDDAFSRYGIARDKFYEWTDTTADMAARSVTAEHILKLKAEAYKHYSTDAGGNMLARCKAAFKLAWESGKIPSTPFAGMHITRGNIHNKGAQIKYLKQEELERIRDKEFVSERLRKVADCFLFACFTGLSFSDMKELVPDDFKTNERGQVYIKKRRKKTGVEFVTILFSDALEIAQKYDYKLPLISGQKYNEYLHEIETLCNIPISLTSHVARHTCATYLLRHKVDIETLQKILGHMHAQQTRHYAKIVDESVFETMQRVADEQFKEDIKRIMEMD